LPPTDDFGAPKGGTDGLLNGIRLLLAEDDKNTSRLLMDYLGACGAEVRHVATGAEAIAMAKADFYDFAIVDLRLPEENGFAVMERIRDQPAPPVIIAISAFHDKQNRVRSLESGAHAFFPKPIDLQELTLTISNLSLQSQACLRRMVAFLKYISELEKKNGDPLPHDDRVGELVRMWRGNAVFEE
jgi:DNA-binding response OmpR family regulator